MHEKAVSRAILQRPAKEQFDAFVLNVWLCVARRHVIHDTPEAGLLYSPTASHSV